MITRAHELAAEDRGMAVHAVSKIASRRTRHALRSVHGWLREDGSLAIFHRRRGPLRARLLSVPATRPARAAGSKPATGPRLGSGDRPCRFLRRFENEPGLYPRRLDSAQQCLSCE